MLRENCRDRLGRAEAELRELEGGSAALLAGWKPGPMGLAWPNRRRRSCGLVPTDVMTALDATWSRVWQLRAKHGTRRPCRQLA